ncbi:4-diphosphocytidyl-2C-methyl-D-erythritol kinase [Sphingomonas sp. Leaf357]|uniref:4-(cytidine 5'-diphospho)-2-C-methyl-D-erythritol kinase n=1 Tax=Sphingomonas sp. Leaf357 TaxID=1736350 RepID=UPI0006F338F6|nr:4-(cytidine 5'-diphospho)-2-C-methyl-D-erythritol kinase [Sphingomonas sp. Leaf357]KQS04908.1 4-diphosphocytidyl-2C-methyl-D-erythritol kinase [Sphingomonas sp. Leaf357]
MILELAPAKINLALHVRARRADGYHELETLFAFLRDGDQIRISPGPASFTIDGPFGAGLATEGDNLVTRAMKSFAQTFEIEPEYIIVLTKNLPIASGIGGGSADAAATLRALARLNHIALDDPRLFACADALGSDVPACLLGRSAIGTGRGEQLAPLDGLTDTPVLLVNPGVAVSTAAVFRGWGGKDLGPIGEGPLLDIARAGRNDLEPPARALAPVIGDVLDRLAKTAPSLARMSGSGATCFALYADGSERSRAADAIRAHDPAWWCLESTLA